MSVSSYQPSIADRNGVTPMRSTPSPTRDSPNQSSHEVESGSKGDSGVRVSLSPEAVSGIARSRATEEPTPSDRPDREPTPKPLVNKERPEKPKQPATQSKTDVRTAQSAPKKVSDGLDLSPEEKRVVSQLQSRDAEVRAHEQAHISASGGLAGGASYSYQEGPDGRRYAVGGEVGISVSSGATPDETIQKAQQVRSAALAPAQPSGQDRAVAAAASQMEAQALRERAELKDAETKKVANGENPDKAGSVEELSSKADGVNPAAEDDKQDGTIEGYGGKRADGKTGHSHAENECPYCKASVSKYASMQA